MHEKQNRFDELYRIVDTVVKCRYLAQKRLNYHNWGSQITLTGLSVGLVIIPLLSLGGFNRNFDPKYIEVMQIVFAVATMAYSLLLGIGNFAVRAERMHTSGLKLSRLLRRIKPYKGKDDPALDSVYDAMTCEYYDVLEGNENHSAVDYNFTLLSLNKRRGAPGMWDDAGTRKYQWWRYALLLTQYYWENGVIFATALFQVLLTFSHYLISLVAVFAWTALMCWRQ
jgi:hypothetical protein